MVFAFIISATKFHLLCSKGINVNTTSELRLRECYQAMPLEAISEDDWLHTDFGRHNNIRPVE